jgi:nascent polypeptide-associated complex subunit alpha
MFGGGGMNPRKMEQMMKQMGIDLEELDAAEVVITLEDGTRLVFDDADVTKMDARGQETYQVVGEPEEMAGGEEPATTDEPEEAQSTGDTTAEGGAIPEDDVKLVAQRTGASKDEARAALEDADGDLAAAIAALE